MCAQSDAIVAKRVESGDVNTTEIHDLATAAGYLVVGEATQQRQSNATYNLGGGKVDELAELVGTTGTETVIVDNELTPQQAFNIEQACPDGTRVIDRFRLVLELFGEQACSRVAKLQVELTELRYSLPRIRNEIRRDVSSEIRIHAESGGKRIQDVRARIDEIERQLDSISDEAARRREQRREDGFDLVAIAGYTNAGKSTLMHRLADDLERAESTPSHPDLDVPAAIEDRLFKTLETTTRRAEIDGRKVLLTDTVGFVDDLPHSFVTSFHETLGEVYDADLVLLLVDASDPTGVFEDTLATSIGIVERAADPIVPVVNKADLVSDDELATKCDLVASSAPEPVAISATGDTSLAALTERIENELPDWDTERLAVPNTSDGMSLLSWLYDNARVHDVTYDASGRKAVVDFEARGKVVARATAKADAICEDSTIEGQQ